ncbi:MAG: hypothetical protein FJZ56_05210 [Chlamydiae bacterium]|nr:hypothetical protein [Chlamydiota bacterium]
MSTIYNLEHLSLSTAEYLSQQANKSENPVDNLESAHVDSVFQNAIKSSQENEQNSVANLVSSMNKADEEKAMNTFVEKLEYFYSYDETLDSIASKIMAIAPKHLSLEQIVDAVIENGSAKHVNSMLDALLHKNPDFSLTPLDQIRKAIIEDTNHELTNESLSCMLETAGLLSDPSNLKKCQKLAYYMNHPNIYPVAEAQVLPSEYTLNFLWVNLNPQDRELDAAQNIFKDGLDLSENAEAIKDPALLSEMENHEALMEENKLKNWSEIKKSFTYRVSKWADLHKDAKMYLWYDSALVTEKARQNTFEMLNSISATRGVDLRLKDIRSLPNMDKELTISMHPGTQVYYRVDMLKALIGDHMATCSEESAKYCVFTDIDVEPMPASQLFDERTKNYLNRNGYVFNRVSLVGNFENSFYIFNKENQYFIKKHREAIIEGLSSRITHLREYPADTALRSDFILDSQVVFNQYRFLRGNIYDIDNDEAPRKVVKCPKSQFNFSSRFAKSDFRSETFRFIYSSKYPYTKGGRNWTSYYESPIDELQSWQAKPLPSKG